MRNPFVLEPYVTKELFCDRQIETENMINLLQNGANITLISPRRYGKTGLIYHVFDNLKEAGSHSCFYVDIYSSQCLDDFINLFTEAIVEILNSTSLIKKFFSYLSGFRPVLKYDPVSGKPEITFAHENEKQKQMTLKAILNYLENQDRPVVVAIDEFQQIREYEEVNMEALLRTYIQPLHNVRFIFCGSKKHTMSNMFTDEHSPFYESTELIFLDRIDEGVYKSFIRLMFSNAHREISDDALDTIISWTLRHTYYTQNLCNRIYAGGKKHIDIKEVNKAITQILKQREGAFLERRNLLTKGQWQYLKAVAKEGTLTQPSSGGFLNKYKIGTASVSKRMLSALIDKELILENTTLEGTEYRIYNVFFMRWLANL